MELTRAEIFNVINSKNLPNIIECDTLTLHPVAFHTHTYEDQEGKEHEVLVIKDGESGKMYKTEVQAFIKKFMSYDEAFGTLPDEEKPRIMVKLVKSKKGNTYVDFIVADAG